MRIFLAFAAAVSLAACTQISNDVLAAAQTLTTLERVALIYTSLPRCASGGPAMCSNAATVQRIKDLDNQAYAAVKAAESNAGLLNAALAAIANFHAAIPAS